MKCFEKLFTLQWEFLISQQIRNVSYVELTSSFQHESLRF